MGEPPTAGTEIDLEIEGVSYDMGGVNSRVAWPQLTQVDYELGRTRELTEREMELNLMLAQERRRQLQLLIELAKLKQARAPRAEQVGEVIECRADSEPAANSLAAGKAAVSAGVLRTERKCAASSEPEKQMPGVLLTTQAAGRSVGPCSDVVAGDSPDTAPLCSQCVENETHAALTAARTAGLETELGSDLIAEANAREDAASPKQYQEVSELQGSCPSFDPLGDSCCGREVGTIASSPSAGAAVETSLVERPRGGNCEADRVSGAHSVASWLKPVDTAEAAPVAVACELPESKEEPRSELAQIGHSVAEAGEASADRFEAGTLWRGRSQAHCGDSSPHVLQAHSLLANNGLRQSADDMGGPLGTAAATEPTLRERATIMATLNYRSLCSHCLCGLAIVMSHAPARACPAGVTGVYKWTAHGNFECYR
ncbi:hypothetical protein HPB50_007293 [Hyalomma asiaticum]|uniref:Uncharacterized protein n=1 Tax=Hyalomma asiaticum TaxID=266040 RepID=A0ACB7RIS5_HYAAI|nr:hypothetical protein HPB50_007293 [Hyalomma asiaticum]